MQTVSKALFGTVAAGAMAVSSATPAAASDRHRDRGIDAGDVIAGAVILGGIAAIASSIGTKDRYRDGYRYTNGYRYDDRRSYRDDRWQRRGNPRNAVERCVRAAERQARRFGGYRSADVTQIRDVDDTRRGWRVEGRIVVDGTRGYGQRARYDKRGYGYGHRAYDQGRFTCYVGRGQRPQVDFRGIRGLR